MPAGRKNSTANFAVSHDDGIVTIAVDGPITTAVGDELMRRSLDALRTYDAHCLLQDVRRARLAESTLQLINRPRMADAMGLPPGTRVALLCKVLTNDHEMLVSLAHTRGHALHAFTDGATAIAWLKDAASATRPARAGRAR
jgi:hypothetical protein